MDLTEIFMPHYVGAVKAMVARSGRFVHYTTAETATSILKNKQVWMRNAALMNDYSEIEHGVGCINEALNGPNGKVFTNLLDSIKPGAFDSIREAHKKIITFSKSETFLLCVSEHLNEEDELGRLSMWRAYGGHSGIAIVMNMEAFFSPSDALTVYSSPVVYADPLSFQFAFDQVVASVSKNIAYLKTLDADVVMATVFRMMVFASLSIKHPGFAEEREWRLIKAPPFGNSSHIQKTIEVVRGIPQRVTKFKLEDIPAENLTGLDIPKLIDRVIVGPTNHPYEIAQTMRELLYNAGVPNPIDRVVISSIPLRQF